MTDNFEKSCANEWQREREKEDVNNNFEMDDCNENKKDPEVLETSEDIVKPDVGDSCENPDERYQANSESEQTIEISKMDVGAEEVNEDHFSKDSDDGSSEKTYQDRQQVQTKEATKMKRTCPQKAPARSKQIELKDDESSRESFCTEEVDGEFPDGDTDYKPGKRVSKARTRRKSVIVKKIHHELVLFVCSHCTFESENLGELKIHQYNNHKGCDAPSYLDMAEAAIAKLENNLGLSERSILKEVLFENFDSIVENKSRAGQLLNQALRGGVKIGRLETNRRRKDNLRYWVVPKERMKLVVENWKKSNESVEFVDSPGKSNLSNVSWNVKNKRKMISEAEISKASPAKADSDSDIAVLDESLTDGTKLRVMRKKLSNVPNPRPLTNISQSKVINPPSPPGPESDEDDPTSLLTCPVCSCSFWYENQTVQHMTDCHPHD